MAQASLVGQRLLIIETSRSHSDTTHSVGLFWTSDQPDAKDFYLTTDNTHNRQTSVPPAGFETAIPVSQQLQTHTLDSATTGMGPPFVCFWRDSPPVGQGLLIHDVPISHTTTHHSQ
jgi:hypothetical protein